MTPDNVLLPRESIFTPPRSTIFYASPATTVAESAAGSISVHHLLLALLSPAAHFVSSPCDFGSSEATNHDAFFLLTN
uniref:Uncharacterized protein n=1 Tax=Aegilops tauschii TaxID=37682 RepID=R7WE04_AEGTA